MNESLITLALPFVIGVSIGVLGFYLFHRTKIGGYRTLARDILSRGELDVDRMKKEAELELKHKLLEQQRDLEAKKAIERQKLQTEESRLQQREDKLETRMNLVEKKLSQIEKREAVIHARKQEFETQKELLSKKEEGVQSLLEKASGLTSNEAKELLISQIKDEVDHDTANYIRKSIKEAEENADREAGRIIASAINRLAVSCVSELTVNTVALPSDEMKGRIIGREGRNIRTLERLTGVNFVIDDTPGAVVLSGFDPVRLHVAKHALTELVTDGRIHPTRIEEAVENAQKSIERKIKEYGEDAAYRTGQTNLHPEIITLLGKLKFRYSIGQNILEHSIEVSRLMGLIAAELHLDTHMAKRIGLLHDMGKAVSHEFEGTHALIGRDFALKYGESNEVANGIGCHHNEIEPITIEGSFCGAADALSASRPGARIEAVDEYVKRIERLEQLAYKFPGVERAYAMQAGRELCIAVLPDQIDDSGAIHLARELSKKIEKEFRYPGKIKVTVIREKRAIEYAM